MDFNALCYLSACMDITFLKKDLKNMEDISMVQYLAIIFVIKITKCRNT